MAGLLVPVNVARLVRLPFDWTRSTRIVTAGGAVSPVESIVVNGAAAVTIGGSQYVPGVPPPWVWSVMRFEVSRLLSLLADWQAAAKTAAINASDAVSDPRIRITASYKRREKRGD